MIVREGEAVKGC